MTCVIISDQDGVVRYLCLPLPLTPPSYLAPLEQPWQASVYVTMWRGVSWCHMQESPPRTRLLRCALDGPLLLCTCVGDCCYICSVDENRNRDVDDWNCASSVLTCTKLKYCKLPEHVEQIDSALVDRVLHLCLVCAHQLLLYKLPPSADAVSCKWLKHPVIHESSCEIMCAKLRYF